MALKVVGSLSGFYKGRFINKDASEVAASSQNDVSTGYPIHIQIAADGAQIAHATTDMRIDGVCVKGTTCGGYPVIELVKPGDIIEADYTGTKSTSFVTGINVALLSTSSNSVDASKISAGSLKILSIDTVNSKVRFIATKTFLTTTTS
jgi:hypothetical protein